MSNEATILEQALEHAAANPAGRPAFLKQFMQSQIYLYQDPPPKSSRGERVLQANEQIALHRIPIEGTMHIPFFTSIERLLDFYKCECGYMQLAARDFLEVTRGTPLILNPGSNHGKYFTPQEVETLLEGKISAGRERITFEKETHIQIGQPARYPTELVEALNTYFNTSKQVRRAYLAHYMAPDQEQHGHTLIVIDCRGDFDRLMERVGAIIDGVHLPDPPVDLMPLSADNNRFLPLMSLFYDANKPGGIVPHSPPTSIRRPWWKFWRQQ